MRPDLGAPGQLLFEGGSFKPANLVTLLRGLLIAPIFALLLAAHHSAALALYVLAASTDVVDGWLARRFGQASEYGAQLDAIVDNIFSLSIFGFLVLAYPGLATRQWPALAVLFGGPVLYLGVSYLLTRRLMMFHVWSAKLGALLLFCLWPALALTHWEGWLVLAAAIVGGSRIEQVVYMLRGGRDLEAVHGFAPVARRVADVESSHSRRAPPIHWGAPTAQQRGPIVAGLGSPETRNVIGVHAGIFGAYRGAAAARGELAKDHQPDLSNTEPSVRIGPFPQWADPAKIVSLDPWGHVAPQAFADLRRSGLDIRPTIAVAAGRIRMPEIAEAAARGRLRPDGQILMADGLINVTKIAIEPVWRLPGVAARLGVPEPELRRALHAQTGGMYPELLSAPDCEVFLPPIAGTSVYLFGDVSRLGEPATMTTCRAHDACHSSDVFGSDLCTCRPYLAFGVGECIRSAQGGGLGIIAYNHKEGRALGEVVKFLVYNARRQGPDGDRADGYFDRTEAVAGVHDMRLQELMPDVFQWLGVRRIDRWISMSHLKHASLLAAGIEVVERVAIPPGLIPQGAEVEIQAKKAAGYFSESGPSTP